MRLLETANVEAALYLGITKLSKKAQRLFATLVQVGEQVRDARGYSRATTQVCYFAPVESIGLAFGVHKTTVYRWLAELRSAGLVDQRGHYCTLRGQTRADGAVWAVRLKPGAKAKLGFDDMKKQYRNLGGDIEAGRTVWAEMQRSKDTSTKQVNLSYILDWALPLTSETPGKVDRSKTKRADLEAIFDLAHVEREDRAAAVDLAAQALAQRLADHSGLNFYRSLLWGCLRASVHLGLDVWHQVYEQARRAYTDAAEGFARRPGALFVSRLKQAPWWDEVRRCPQVRVRAVPRTAVAQEGAVRDSYL